MRTFLLLILALPLHVFADAPECPVFSNKKDCVQSVEENYKNLLDFIEEEYTGDKTELIEAANNIKYYENRSCQKTCLN